MKWLICIICDRDYICSVKCKRVYYFFLNIYLGIFENIVTLKGIYDNVVIVLTAHILHLKIVIASLSIGFNIQ